MKTMVKIDGEKFYYDLERIHCVNDVIEGNLVVVKHPETHELCKAKVCYLHKNGIGVKDEADDIAAYRWFIHKRSLFNQVFLIKKQYKGG